MYRLGKHIEWLHRTKMICRSKGRGCGDVGALRLPWVLMSMAKNMQIACQRSWIARNIHNASNRVLHKGVENNLLTTRTRWVKHKPIELCCQPRQKVFRFPLEDIYIADIAQVPLCILDRAGRLFNGNYPTDMAR